MQIEVTFDRENAGTYLSTAVLAYHEALYFALNELAAVKDGNLTWLDQIENYAIDTAKGTVTENIPMELETNAVEFATQLIGDAFASYRSRLNRG